MFPLAHRQSHFRRGVVDIDAGALSLGSSLMEAGTPAYEPGVPPKFRIGPPSSIKLFWQGSGGGQHTPLILACGKQREANL